MPGTSSEVQRGRSTSAAVLMRHQRSRIGSWVGGTHKGLAVEKNKVGWGSELCGPFLSVRDPTDKNIPHREKIDRTIVFFSRHGFKTGDSSKTERFFFVLGSDCPL